MNKFNFKFFVVACSIVLLFNLMFIIVVAFATEKEATHSPSKMKFYDVFNYNADENIDDYYLLNWEYSSDDSLNCSKLPKEVLDVDLIRLTRFESVAIQLLQNKNNSIIQIKGYSVDTTHKTFVNSVKVVDIYGTFYIIVDFSEYIDDSWNLTSAVYKSEKDISSLYEFQTDKSHYYSYDFYPMRLSPFFSSVFGRILKVLFVVGEISAVYFVLIKRSSKNNQGRERKQSGDGSMIEP